MESTDFHHGYSFVARDQLAKDMCHDILKTGWPVSFKSSLPHNLTREDKVVQALGKLNAL
jgi:hypothetical protein